MIQLLKKDRSYVHYLIAVVLGLLAYALIPLNNGLTPVGKNILVFIIPVIFLWVTESNGWVSLLAVGLMVIAGLNYEALISASWGNHLVATVACAIALTIAMQKTGVTEYLASWFYTRKLIEGHPYRFLFMFFLALFVLSLFLNPEATAILFISLAESIMKRVGYGKKDKCYTMIMLCILWICSTCEAATPIGHPLPLMMIALIESSTGVSVTFFDWMKLGIPFGILMFAAILLIVRFVWKPDIEKFKELDIESLKKERTKIDTKGKITITVFVLVVLAWLLPQFVSFMPPAAGAFVSNIGMAIPPMIGLALLNAIHIDGEPIAEMADLFRQIPWKIIVFLIAILAFSANLSSPDTGISGFLSKSIAPAMNMMPIVMVLFFSILGTLIMTNFFSNGASMVLFFYLTQPLLAGAGGMISPVALGIILCCSANLAFLMAPSSTYCALFFGEHIQIKSTLKYNLVYMLIGMVVQLSILVPLGQNIFHM